MKTLIIVAHPELADSGTQAFLKGALRHVANVTWHPIAQLYPDFQIDVAAEQQLLATHDQIIFQFPMYWYSAPAILKQWEDDVLTRTFTYRNEAGRLAAKQLGIVVTLGNPLRHFTAGGVEGVSISELMRPYQALAKQAGMRFLPPLAVDQFGYMDNGQKDRLVVAYQNAIANPDPESFNGRVEWAGTQLAELKTRITDETTQARMAMVIEQLKDRQSTLADLKEQINMIKQGDDE